MTNITKHPTLWKQDTKGKVRIWYMEIDDNQYRTVAGLHDGKRVTSAWTVVEGKNIGRANETTPAEQAVFEVGAHYAKKLRVDYHTDLVSINEAKIFKPMLAAKWEDVMHKIDYKKQNVYIQPKLDGIRCIATADGLFSRTGKPILGAPHIHKQLSSLFDMDPDIILDGELYNHELKSDFNTIVSLVKKAKPTTEGAKMVEYHVYDLPSLSDAKFNERTLTLDRLLGGDLGKGSPNIVNVETLRVESQCDVDREYSRFIGRGYEGGIVRIDGKYEQKRSKLLLKRKDFEDAEFTIVRVEEGSGNWAGAAKRVICINDQTWEEFGAGLAGTYEYAQTVLAEAESYVGKQATIQFFTRTPAGVPRFPIAKVLHKTKRM
jgi:DNA ligase-1